MRAGGGAPGLGDRLRSERRRLGLSQDELAKSLGIHRRTQANYELGKTLPDASYFRAVQRLGIDSVYVETGERGGSRDLQAALAERLLLSLCDALQIPPEKVYEAIQPPDLSAGLQGGFNEMVNGLLRSSQLLNVQCRQQRLDRDLLVDVVEGLELFLRVEKRSVSALRKAHAIASLYRDFAETGRFDADRLVSVARSIPDG